MPHILLEPHGDISLKKSTNFDFIAKGQYDQKICAHIDDKEFLLTKVRKNENDLIKALEEKKIAGVGLDVYDNEPLPENHKLRFLPNAFLTPHLGYVIEQNYEIFYSQMAENLQSFLDGTPQRVIDGDPSKII